MTPPLAKLRKISYLARKSGRPYRTLFRQIMALHALDRERGEPPWMFRLSDGGHWVVNETELRRLHPELYERRYVTREEHEELGRRVADLEASQRDDRKRLGGLGARVVRLESAQKAHSA